MFIDWTKFTHFKCVNLFECSWYVVCWHWNSCDLSFAVPIRPINGVNWDWARWNIENERTSICQIKKSKRITRSPVEVLKLGFQSARHPQLKKGLTTLNAIVFFLFTVLLLLKSSSADFDAPCAKSMHRLQCNIYVFPVITEEH